MNKIVPEDSILIPENATRVFKGVVFEVYAWPQKMFDGSSKTFEMIKRPDSVDILVVRDNEVLILRDEQPNRHAILSLPSGRVDKNESWDDAAKRELEEEAGIRCNGWKLVYVEQPVHKMEWFIATFVANDITETVEQHLDNGEKIELMWRDYIELRKSILKGEAPDLEYLLPLIRRAATTADLLTLPSFTGKEVKA